MFTSDEWLESRAAKDPKGKKASDIVLMPSFWNDVVYALKAMGPIVRVLRLVDNEKRPAMSYIYEAMDRAKEAIQKAFNGEEENNLNSEMDCEVLEGLYKCIDRLSENDEFLDHIHNKLSIYKRAGGMFGFPTALRKRTTMAPSKWGSSFIICIFILITFQIANLSNHFDTNVYELHYNSVLEDLVVMRIGVPLSIREADSSIKSFKTWFMLNITKLLMNATRVLENGLVEAVAVLISKMPRLRPESAGKLGECYKSKPDFIKAWEKWRSQITKLDCSPFWIQCDNQQTREGLRNLLQIMLGNTESLCMATCYWIELYISHFLYIRPFTTGIESMYNLAEKCIQLKPRSSTHRLSGLMIGILEENTEVIIALLVAHAIELLTAGSEQAEILLHEERYNLGGISIVELHRLVYAQILSSHALTWQIAPIYLTSCMKQGMGLLENLLYRQSVQHNDVLLKNIEICRLYELDHISSNIMKIAGVYHWKHGHKGAGVFWLQQAQDASCLDRIAQQLFDSVGKSISDESFKQWEGMIELLGSESKPAGGLDFLHKYRDFKKSLQKVSSGKSTDVARQAVGSLILLMKNPSTPQRFWLPLLFDSLKLLNWQDCPLLSVSETNLLLNKLQELSLARLRPHCTEPTLPSDALSSIRVALATNLGRAILDE
ncbi:Nuclear pore complex protein NUP85, partial [Mucuna pruriens]